MSRLLPFSQVGIAHGMLRARDSRAVDYNVEAAPRHQYARHGLTYGVFASDIGEEGFTAVRKQCDEWTPGKFG